MPSLACTVRTASCFSRSTTKVTQQDIDRVLQANVEQTYLNIARTFSTTLRRNEINKIYSSPSKAIEGMESNSTLLCGGFGLSGVPDTLIVSNVPVRTAYETLLTWYLNI
jgi:3-oxoacid CoA-transferase